jgi:hypothetical protein
MVAKQRQRLARASFWPAWAIAGPDGKIYALGGNNGTITFLDTAEAYDPYTDTWTTVAPMPTARRDLAATAGVRNGVGAIYVFGGHGADFPLTTVEVYLP